MICLLLFSTHSLSFLCTTGPFYSLLAVCIYIISCSRTYLLQGHLTLLFQNVCNGLLITKSMRCINWQCRRIMSKLRLWLMVNVVHLQHVIVMVQFSTGQSHLLSYSVFRSTSKLCGKFPSVGPFVRPQKVSSISMKFGIQVVLDERWKKDNDHARIHVFMFRSQWKSEIRPFWTIFKLSPPPFIMEADKWPRVLKLGGNI